MYSYKYIYLYLCDRERGGGGYFHTTENRSDSKNFILIRDKK